MRECENDREERREEKHAIEHKYMKQIQHNTTQNNTSMAK